MAHGGGASADEAIPEQSLVFWFNLLGHTNLRHSGLWLQVYCYNLNLFVDDHLPIYLSQRVQQLEDDLRSERLKHLVTTERLQLLREQHLILLNQQLNSLKAEEDSLKTAARARAGAAAGTAAGPSAAAACAGTAAGLAPALGGDSLDTTAANGRRRRHAARASATAGASARVGGRVDNEGKWTSEGEAGGAKGSGGGRATRW